MHEVSGYRCITLGLMAMEEPETSTGRRARVGESGAPIGSALSIVLAVVAAVLGFFILRQISDEGGTSVSSADTGDGGIQVPADDPEESPDGTSDDQTTTTTEAPVEQNQFEGAMVVVANGAREGGLAGSLSDQLAMLGFQLPEENAAIDASGGDVVEQTTIYWRRRNDSAEAVAETVRRAFGDQSIAIEPYSNDAPVASDQFNGAVVVVVGADHVETTLQQPPDPSAAAPQPGENGGGGEGDGDGG